MIFEITFNCFLCICKAVETSDGFLKDQFFTEANNPCSLILKSRSREFLLLPGNEFWEVNKPKNRNTSLRN